MSVWFKGIILAALLAALGHMYLRAIDFKGVEAKLGIEQQKNASLVEQIAKARARERQFQQEVDRAHSEYAKTRALRERYAQSQRALDRLHHAFTVACSGSTDSAGTPTPTTGSDGTPADKGLPESTDGSVIRRLQGLMFQADRDADNLRLLQDWARGAMQLCNGE